MLNTQTGERPLYFFLGSSGEEVSVILAQSGGAGNRVRVLVTAGDKAVGEHTINEVLPLTFALVQTKLVYLKQPNPAASSQVTGAWALDLSTGASAPVPLPCTPLLLASDGGRLAMAGPDPMGTMMLSVVDAAFKQVATTSIPDVSRGELLRSFLSYAAGNTILFVNPSNASYTRFDIGNALKRGPRVQLSGSEITLSKQKQPAGQTLRSIVILAHLTARSGKDLFLLGPYKPSEGFRLAE
ncbi:MAG: hypothetical protein HZB13_19990, partial [Acidobacteria bacterium]|nr:hypothetical protein [Acidobacteriota bacterium]